MGGSCRSSVRGQAVQESVGGQDEPKLALKSGHVWGILGILGAKVGAVRGILGGGSTLEPRYRWGSSGRHDK